MRFSATVVYRVLRNHIVYFPGELLDRLTGKFSTFINNVGIWQTPGNEITLG